MRASVVSLVALFSFFAAAQVACGGGDALPPVGAGGDSGIAPTPLPGASSSASPEGGAVLPGQEPRPDGGAVAVPPPPPTKPNEITEAFGVFVSTAGRANASGTRAAPLSSIDAAIARAKDENKKKVFVCEGSYAEAITLADGVSIEGRLDCTDPAAWKLDETKHVSLDAPSSPAVRATNIPSATRIDGLHVNSPAATTPSGSSIALLAVDASGLTFSNGSLTAGDGMKGDDGIEGEQLVAMPTGWPREQGERYAPCFWEGVRCTEANDWQRYRRLPGQVGCMAGGREVSVSRGGLGGASGLYWRNSSLDRWTLRDAASVGAAGIGTGADGTNGTNGGSGSFSEAGFTPENGTAGTSGDVGRGGAGGDGGGIPTAMYETDFWWGNLGGGGAAGGCQGLAGTAGHGGGASVGVLAIRSALQVTASSITTGAGGAGGSGTLGSDATAGSVTGEAQNVDYAGKDGARGGFAGYSGGGAGGPSIAIAHTGEVVTTTIRVTVGAGGAGGAEQQRNVLGTARVLPAAAAGEALENKTF